MGYYVRILTPEKRGIAASTVLKAIEPMGDVTARFEGPKKAWSEAFIECGEDSILSIERNAVSAGSLGEEEVAELDAELSEALPRSGAEWTREYLKKVRTIYAIQIFAGADDHGEVAGAVIEAMRGAAGGIVQADFEGFSNEAGNCIVWQFSDAASGPWSMAVLDEAGAWVTFKLDLGDRAQRQTFLRGEAPRGK